ncbi:hypothetical protein RR48_05949 [Papilio machaon]|uniref:Uncharacterized protein n=1 Tax=Papilio machaon TaxID=76193 RepID=A0A0N1IIE0_PAPMA|nr:hypothetical protein RR48_05949 [Papilio machaon]
MAARALFQPLFRGTRHIMRLMDVQSAVVFCDVSLHNKVAIRSTGVSMYRRVDVQDTLML